MSAPIVRSWAAEEKRLASLSAGGRCCLCGTGSDLVTASRRGVRMCRRCRDHTTSVGLITGMDGEPVFWWDCTCKESGTDFKTRGSALESAQRHEKEAA